jgi:hypothetical protein
MIIGINFESIPRNTGIPIPRKRAAMKAGVYKAVQYCKDIPEEIKLQAMQKCLEMGFNPYIEEYGIPDL